MQKRSIITVFVLSLIAALLLSSCSENAISSSQTVQPPGSIAQPLIEIVSFSTTPWQGTIPTPEPEIQITLKNIADEPIINLTATLALSSNFDSVLFTFDVTPANPLEPGNTSSASHFIIGEYTSAPLTINAVLQSGITSSFTLQPQM